MFHISGKRAMSAPIALARRQYSSPLRRLAPWSAPQAVSCSKATVNSATCVLLSTNRAVGGAGVERWRARPGEVGRREAPWPGRGLMEGGWASTEVVAHRFSHSTGDRVRPVQLYRNVSADAIRAARARRGGAGRLSPGRGPRRPRAPRTAPPAPPVAAGSRPPPGPAPPCPTGSPPAAPPSRGRPRRGRPGTPAVV